MQVQLPQAERVWIEKHRADRDLRGLVQTGVRQLQFLSRESADHRNSWAGNIRGAIELDHPPGPSIAVTQGLYEMTIGALHRWRPKKWESQVKYQETQRCCRAARGAELEGDRDGR